MGDSADAPARGHRKRQAGPKADRKKQNKQKDGEESGGKQNQRNAKGFTFKSAVRASRQARRTMDVAAKRIHVPAVDRTPREPPPVLIAVVGPPQVGKSTLIASLIKNFTRQNVADAAGPITVVSGRKRRLTFVECNNDIGSMIDIAKVADLVLLLIDASFGFEMEVFEFLNVCQVHGFPRIMGVLTHLDVFKQAKTVQKTKKQLKHRFWREIYDGAKLFYLSGLVHGHYPKMEIHNLGRFISVMKFRPLQWRSTHPYILTDRFEDLTDPERVREDPKCNRTVSLYGYVRGTHMKEGSSVHVAGVGDFMMSSLSELSDPCPLPDAVKRRRSLNDREQKIYAPMAGVGGIVYDKDAVYVDLGTKGGAADSESVSALKESVMDLDMATNNLDENTAQLSMQLYQGDGSEDNADSRFGAVRSKDVVVEGGRVRRRAVFDDEDENAGSDDDDDDDEGDSSDDDDEGADADVAQNLGSVLDKWCGGDDNIEEEDEEADSDDESADEDDDSDVSEEDTDDEDEEEEEEEEDEEDEEMDVDDDDEQEQDMHAIGSSRWKENLVSQAAASYRARAQTSINLQKLVYGATESDGSKDSGTTSAADDGGADDIAGLFKVRRSVGTSSKVDMSDTIAQRPVTEQVCTAERVHCRDSSCQAPRTTQWDDAFMVKLKNLFVTGEAAESELRAQLAEDDDMDEELYGDFEDLETGEVHHASDDDSGISDEDSDDYDDGEAGGKAGRSGGKSRGNSGGPAESQEESRRRLKEEKKKKMLEMLSSDDKDGGSSYYDGLKEEASVQTERNDKLFEGVDDLTRTQLEGFRPGSYVRLEIRGMPCEFVEHFDPRFPVILGGLLSGEQNIGYIRGRIKKHRWHKRILKTRDPVIISLGWRRYQTMPVYSSEDHNLRQRFLKYTPEHMHCISTMYGPVTPPGTGFLAIQTLESSTRDFRIAAAGVILELDQSVNVVKKLKLVGTPMKIFKNTAFIKGMFNSALEVAKFQGVAIRTVSGIRGQIKKAIKAPDGAFRATFEDKLLMSDIVFVRAWCPVKVPSYYNPVTSLLQQDKSTWSGMRTVGQLRFELGVKAPHKKDSIYKPIVRERRRFNPFQVPKSLQKQLPFKSREKDWVGKSDPSKPKPFKKRAPSDERKVSAMMQQLNVMHKEKRRKKHLQAKDNLAKFHKEQEKQREKAESALRRNRKEFYQKVGAQNSKGQRRGKKGGGGDDD